MAGETPKFCFKTLDDLLDTEDFKCSSRDRSFQATKKEIYNKMYLDFIARETHTNEIKEVDWKDWLLPTSGVFVCDTETKKYEMIQSQSTKDSDREECIWSNEELRTLRKCFHRLRLRNAALVGKVDSLQKELLDCKKNQAMTNVTVTSLKEKWAELKKRYRRIKISCKSMKEDLTTYHSSLKSAGEEIHNLQNERNLLLKDLNEIKIKLDLETIRNRDLETQLKEKDRKNMEALRHCGFIMRQQCKLKETSLKKEIFQLKEELKKERQENRLNKSALENLRNHFACVELIDQNCFGLDNILSAADIDFTKQI